MTMTRTRNEWQNHNTNNAEKPLDKRRNAPSPGCCVVPRAKCYARSNQAANVIEVIEDSHTPSSPFIRQCLRQIRRTAQPRSGCAKADEYARDNEHGDILSSGLDDDGDDSQHGCPELSGTPADKVGYSSPTKASKHSSDPDGGGVEADVYSIVVQSEEVEVLREDIETISAEA